MKSWITKLPKEQQARIYKWAESQFRSKQLEYLPIEFLEWYSGTTKERLVEMYKSWIKREEKAGGRFYDDKEIERIKMDAFIKGLTQE